MRQDPLPGGAVAQHPRADVGLQRRGGAGGERRPAGRALLLREPRRGQERRDAERHHQGRRDHGDKRGHRLRPGHDVPGERAPGGAGAVHDDEVVEDRAPGPGGDPEGDRRHHREPGVSAAAFRAPGYQRGDDLGAHRACAG